MYMSVYVEKHGNYKNMCIILNIYMVQRRPATPLLPNGDGWPVWLLMVPPLPPVACVWDACRHVCMYVGR